MKFFEKFFIFILLISLLSFSHAIGDFNNQYTINNMDNLTEFEFSIEDGENYEIIFHLLKKTNFGLLVEIDRDELDISYSDPLDNKQSFEIDNCDPKIYANQEIGSHTFNVKNPGTFSGGRIIKITAQAYISDNISVIENTLKCPEKNVQGFGLFSILVSSLITIIIIKKGNKKFS
ncbi:MAG: hypothetical protein HeimC3_50240 [Candidatus Heimdallarchaeota archaeon LC_3]|nr:MAG: hypothetical protein HeimC3_50240 [Candidatus Heimdallarchaeota archaeon LC_3]